MTTDQETGEKHVRPFGEWLALEDHGRLHDDLSDQLNELIDAVCNTSKKGTLTLQIAVSPSTKTPMGEVAMVTVAPTITLKAPRPSASESIYFVDKWRNLIRDNPAQPKLPLRQVPTTPPVRGDESKEA